MIASVTKIAPKIDIIKQKQQVELSSQKSESKN